MKPDIKIVAHDIRSTHNVGAIFRTADGLGVSQIFLTGYTPYPVDSNDDRLPHIRTKIENQIDKTALGAHKNVNWTHAKNVAPVIESLKNSGYTVVGLEQSNNSTPLHRYIAPKKIALLLGEEVEGITTALLKQCDDIVEIPMFGIKESFNVSVAAGMALYRFRFY